MAMKQLMLGDWYNFHVVKPLRMVGTVEIVELLAVPPSRLLEYDWGVRVVWEKVGPYASSHPGGYSFPAKSVRSARIRAFNYARECAESTYGCPDARKLSSCRRRVKAELTFDTGEAIKVETLFDEGLRFFFREPGKRTWDLGIPREFLTAEVR